MEISSFLDDKPVGPGISISDREKWDKLMTAAAFKKVVADAEKLLKEPMPPTTDDLYLDFSRTGNRTRWQDVNFTRRSRIKIFTIAECLENKGRFIKPLEATIGEICKEKVWVMPAHDRKLENFEGKFIEIDLASSMLGLNMATSYFVLGDKLSADCRKLIEDNIGRRILGPYRNMLSGKQPMIWWMTGENNWNAVCLGNVTAVGLIMIDSKEERARFISEALKYIKYYIAGFTDDGYCSEGMGYWNYGFGHFAGLAEAILKATHGKINLFNDRKVKTITEFASNIQIINGVCPAFADCDISAKPMGSLVKYIDYRYGRTACCDNFTIDSDLFYSLSISFPEKTEIPALPEKESDLRRSWFNNAGILVCRPDKDSSCKIGVALKGGHNGEQHNHNDVGSFVIVQGKEPIVLDPGGEVYTARTFSGNRYESKLLNSFGHPVPVVAGQLQKTGKEAKAEVLKTVFSPECDTLELDMKQVYDVKELKSLKRTFVYSRKGSGSLTVSDEVSFTKPMTFETTILTFGTFEKKSDTSIVISAGKEKILAEISTDGGNIEIASEEIKEERHGKQNPVRISLKLEKPVEKATITVKYSPLQG